MATRAFAKMTTDFHDEPSIRALTAEQQWAYEVILKRPDLSRCGVVAYTPRRWAKFAHAMTEKKLRRLYDQLVDTRHIVLDDDTEEVLARTYVRHDGLLTQPNVVAAMVSDYRLVNSPTIRTAFLIEMRRIWDLDLEHNARGGWLLAVGHYPQPCNDGTAKFPDGMTSRLLATLGKTIGTGLAPDITEAIRQGSVQPFDEGSEKGSPEPFQEGSRGRVHASPSPATATAPVAAAASTDPAGPEPRSSSHEQHLLDTHQADLGPLPTITAKALARHIHTALNEHPDQVILAALEDWRRRPDAKPGLLPHLIGDAARRPPEPDPNDPLAGLDPDARAWVAEQQAARAAGGTR